MPRLQNKRHEAFAQALSRGLSATEAYERVGYAPNRAHASRLAADGNVKLRLKELQARATGAITVTKAWVLEGLVEIVEKCLQRRKVIIQVPEEDGRIIEVYGDFNPGGAKGALQLIGTELGMFVERKELGPPGAFDRLDDEALERSLVAAIVAGRLGLGRPDAGGAAPQESEEEPR